MLDIDGAVARCGCRIGLGPVRVVLDQGARLGVVDIQALAHRVFLDISDDQDEAGAVAADLVGLGVGAVHPETPFAGARDRHLHVFEKIASTPNRYPRRPGMARKRPLAG